MSREISETGKQMLAFQTQMAEKYQYKPIPIDLFIGDIREKYRETLPEWCSNILDTDNCPLFTSEGTKIVNGFKRIVIGDYGAFVEIDKSQINKSAIKVKEGQEYRYTDDRFSKHVKYLWLTAKDTSDCKIYFQKKTVDYADYLPGMYYISPFEVFPEQEQ